MLKPFPDRVKATKAFITVVYKELGANYDKIHNLQEQGRYAISKAEGFYLNYENDLSRSEKIPFKGYEAEYRTDDVTGDKRLYYNREKPYERTIDFYPYLRGKNFTQKPDFYLIPQAWGEIVEKLKNNGVVFTELEKDSTVEAESIRSGRLQGPLPV